MSASPASDRAVAPTDEPMNLPTPPDETMWLSVDQRASARRRPLLSFLLNYAHPDNRSLASAFGVAAPQAVESSEALHSDGKSSDLAQDALSIEAFESYSPNSVFQFFLGEFEYPLSPLADGLDDWPTRLDHLSMGPSDPLLSPLQWAANKLVDEISHFASSSLQQRHAGRTFHDGLQAGLSLFTASKIGHFVDDYFLRWNHHSPIIHAASFDASTAHTPLLLAVCLTSALLTPDSEDALAARAMLDLAEEYIFEHNDFQRVLGASSAQEIYTIDASLPAVQAAFSIAQIQLRQGVHAKAESIRDHRFDQLVTAVKRLGLLAGPTSTTPEDFDWTAFGIVQAGTRLAFGIYNLDVSFSTFYDRPPRIFTEEMQLPLPCGVDAFMATTAQTCYESWAAASLSRPDTLNDALQAFYADEDSDEVNGMLESLNTLDLFIVILGTCLLG